MVVEVVVDVLVVVEVEMVVDGGVTGRTVTTGRKAGTVVVVVDLGTVVVVVGGTVVVVDGGTVVDVVVVETGVVVVVVDAGTVVLVVVVVVGAAAAVGLFIPHAAGTNNAGTSSAVARRRSRLRCSVDIRNKLLAPRRVTPGRPRR